MDDNETTPLLNEHGAAHAHQEGARKREVSPKKLSWREILTPQSQLVLFAYAALGLHSLAFDSVFPVFLNYPVEESGGNLGMKLPFKFIGGFGIGKCCTLLGQVLCHDSSLTKLTIRW